MASDAKKEVLGLERRYWDAVKNKDAAAVTELTDERCIVVGPQGVREFNRADLAEMMQSPGYEVRAYGFDEKMANVLTPADGVAVVAYKVREDMTNNGQDSTLEAYDSTVWVRRGDRWVCSMHTETPAAA